MLMQQRPSLKTHGAGWARAAVATAAAAVGAAEGAGRGRRRGHGLVAAAPAARMKSVVVWLLAWFSSSDSQANEEELRGGRQAARLSGERLTVQRQDGRLRP